MVCIVNLIFFFLNLRMSSPPLILEKSKKSDLDFPIVLELTLLCDKITEAQPEI